MASHKFLQLRDFTGGVKPNATYFVDRIKYDGVKGTPYMFEEFLPSILLTTDSGDYYLEQTNINLLSKNFEILDKRQAFTFDNNQILLIDFKLKNRTSVKVRYISMLNEYVEILFDDDIKLLLAYDLEIKEPDYRPDLNIGSKLTTYNKEKFYYIWNGKTEFSPINNKRDAKKYLKENYPNKNVKMMLKPHSFKTQSDLIKLVEDINSL
ncbi:hypothetical protein QYS48_28935 [Marivirga arenosa]|uniref:Uncharacterized protein n=1 Tax=Marivirga arenosa TaxID=3059076 RepID=A0AA51R7C2_9BACT|nr:hypothetical protein [Marivirga sp. ABR2-2]WMN07492.1 hypothetical protein QYS48_28935 [Marivirga sp. ABR2-2]